MTSKSLVAEFVSSSTLSKACQYALTRWKKLTHFLEYPELELSTNLAENSMRPVALGRKNWTHIGSSLAGPKVAAILSVVLPQAESPGARLLFCDSPRTCRFPDPAPPRPYSRSVGRPALMNPSNGVQG
jgi:Transposase IS66 family